MSAPSLRALRAQAAPALVENDREAGCYRVTAPAGKRFEPELHELIAWYDLGVQWMPEAREAIAEMLADPCYRVEDCDDPNCEWCADLRAEENDNA